MNSQHSGIMDKDKGELEIITQNKLKIFDAANIIFNFAPEEIGFICRLMVSASLPHSKITSLCYKRKMNHFTFSIVGNEEAGGIPYGTYPRLILSWLSGEVVKTKSREIILGESLSDFMKKLGLSVTGGRWGTITRFREQLKKLFSSSISFSYEEKGKWLHTTMNIADKTLLFWNPNSLDNIDLFKSKILISESFFEEIIKAPIPVDIRAINVLKDSSLALDIYYWLTYRMSYLKTSISIPYEKLQIQFGSGYADTPHGRYEFKRKFLIQFKKVLVVYPEAKIKIENDSIVFYPSPSHIKKIKKNCYS